MCCSVGVAFGNPSYLLDGWTWTACHRRSWAAVFDHVQIPMVVAFVRACSPSVQYLECLEVSGSYTVFGSLHGPLTAKTKELAQQHL